MGHFNITVDWSNRLGCKGCICDQNLNRYRFARHWICFVNTCFRIRVTEWVDTIELVVSTAIPEVTVVEDGVDDRRRVPSRNLTGVDGSLGVDRVLLNDACIDCGAGDAREDCLEDTLAADDVVRRTNLW
jgi:hypothetical protein